MPLHDTMPTFMNFRWVLDLLEFKNQVSQRFAGNQSCPGVWNPFPFLAWDQSMHPRTKIWFFNQFICTGACACSPSLNCAHKMLRNQLMYKNVQTNPKKSKIEHNTLVILSWHSKKFERNKRKHISFRPQRWHVPYRNHHTCCEKLWFVRSLYPNLPQMGIFLPRHVGCHSLIPCQVSWILDEFWIY